KSLYRFESPEAASFSNIDFSELTEVRSLLERGLCDNPSILSSEGNLIRPGYNPELDELQKLKKHGRTRLETYLEKEKSETGIANLKLRYNRLIGYYFEVSNSQLSRVPPYFIRRQGLASAERFSTEHLAKYESDINGASDKIVELEKQLFLELREKVKARLDRLTAAAKIIAEFDVCQSLAWTATVRGWTRPLLNNETRTFITEARHPVVEATLSGGEFIPNDVRLDGKGLFFALITGPNMAGKSTYLRQTALITIMAQMGSFVPAREAIIGITDRIYCRVGASDNLVRGESTFLVEMNETAHILNTATERSLVLMDEVGRGTGTVDGLAIAWAVCEDLLDRVKSRTLFATHFHELSRLEHSGMANRSMDVLEENGKVVFLRKLKEGPSAESYGLYVAGLAGLPGIVLDRAEEIMELIREKDFLHYAENGCSGTSINKSFDTKMPNNDGKIITNEKRLLEELSILDSNKITPLAALNMISRWKELLKQDRPVKQYEHSAVGPSLFD
ncbi:MAG: DNA mismatch repair protein MutS, partial [Treponema sp.]|nr:DNA mismatch repair protein MutS [Treponema sp.]